MAASVVQVGNARHASGSVSVTLNSVAAGSTLVALCYSFNDTNYTLDDGGTAMTKDVDYYQPTAGGYVTSVWSRANVASGNHTINLTGGSTNSMLWVFEIAGGSTMVFDVSAVANAGDYGITIGPTPTTTGAHAVALSLIHGASSLAPGQPSGWSDHGDLTDTDYGRNGGSASRVLTETQAVSAVWTSNVSTIKTGVLAVYKESSGGGGSILPLVRGGMAYLDDMRV